MPIQNALFRKKSGDTALQISMQYGALNSLEMEENKLAISNVLTSFWGCHLAMSQFGGHLRVEIHFCN